MADFPARFDPPLDRGHRRLRGQLRHWSRVTANVTGFAAGVTLWLRF